jgi:hypothetical protein
MFNLFKSNKEKRPEDVKSLRESILMFIKDELRKLEGGEGGHLRSMQLFFAPSQEDKHLYARAVYAEEEGRFQNEEVQRIIDDYAIDVPQQWILQIFFTDQLPASSKKAEDLEAAILINAHHKQTENQNPTAYIRVLGGEAEKKYYTITDTMGKITIGREKEVQTASGFHRNNTIAFPGNSANAGNKFISRDHAHIKFDEETGCFMLYADEGGVPPRNKIKVRSEKGELFKLQTTGIGHPLREGDQVILGETALLEFSYANNESE